MSKSELRELLKDSLEVRTEIECPAFTGPQLKTTLSFDGEVLSETTTSISLSDLKSDGMYY